MQFTIPSLPMKLGWGILSITFVVVLSFPITGCGTTALEHRAVNDYAQVSAAYGDLLENDFLSMFIGMTLLESTSIAFKPESHNEEDHRVSIKTLSDIRFAVGLSAYVLRTNGEVLLALLEGDTPVLNSYAKEFVAALKAAETRFPGKLPFDSQRVKEMEKFDAAILSKEELRERVILQLSKYNPLAIDNWKSTMQSFEHAYAFWAITARNRSYTAMTDSEQSLMTRLAASEKHVKAAELSMVFDSFVEKHNGTLNEFSQATTEVLKAVKDPQYTREDLKALLVRLEQLLKYIEQTSSIAKRIAALLVVF